MADHFLREVAGFGTVAFTANKAARLRGQGGEFGAFGHVHLTPSSYPAASIAQATICYPACDILACGMWCAGIAAWGEVNVKFLVSRIYEAITGTAAPSIPAVRRAIGAGAPCEANLRAWRDGARLPSERDVFYLLALADKNRPAFSQEHEAEIRDAWWTEAKARAAGGLRKVPNA